ncbi:MAG: hypothetical protein LBP91_03610 [Coriobacteriales bacterium]|jgi:hypothetical protein|nr:hypothetical protein [Coriobacteriales bacterium]
MKSALKKNTYRWWGITTGLCLFVAGVFLAPCFFPAPAQRAFADEAPQSQENVVLEESNGEETTATSPEEEYFSYEELADAQIAHADDLTTITIPKSKVPLSRFLQTGQSPGISGSYFNTVLVGLSMAFLLAMLLLLLARKTSDHRVTAGRIIAATVGLATIVTWSHLDRLQTPTVLFNEVSAVIATLFCVFVALSIASYVYEFRLNKNEVSEQEE